MADAPDGIDVDGVTPLFMPGTMADAYRAMGGEVVLYGKPGVSHFAAALRAAGVDDAGRALMVGDSLHHDILGAAAAVTTSRTTRSKPSVGGALALLPSAALASTSLGAAAARAARDAARGARRSMARAAIPGLIPGSRAASHAHRASESALSSRASEHARARLAALAFESDADDDAWADDHSDALSDSDSDDGMFFFGEKR